VTEHTPDRPGQPAEASASARTKLLVCLVVGLLAAAAAVLAGAGTSAPLIGWDVLAVTFCAWMWRAATIVPGGDL
jgi:hypothetical protein